MERDVQSWPWWLRLPVGIWLYTCLTTAAIGIEDRTDRLLNATARIAVAWWVLGLAQLLVIRRRDWIRLTRRVQVAAATMVCGVATLLAHIRLAFDWLGDSHAALVEHTRRTAGVGWGVYVNYLFAVVWLADAVWLTAATRSYARRPRWVGRAIHGFLAFVVFNATVVYGEPATRLAGVVWFAILGYSWWRAGRAQGRSASEGVARPR